MARRRLPMPVRRALSLWMLSACAATAAAADRPDAAQQARNWAAACANCHGPEGRAPADSPIPALAGRPQSALVGQMQAFRSGQREATVMGQIARGYSDEQIAAIAAWFAGMR